MSIVDREVAALRPLFGRYFVRRLRHVKNNTDTVFVIVALNALVSVSCVASDDAVGLRRKLGFLKVAQRVDLRCLVLRCRLEVGAAR